MSKATNVIQFPGQRVSGPDVELMAAVNAHLRHEAAPSENGHRRASGRPWSEDLVFHYISKHREAVLSNNLRDVELYKRCLIHGGATTRKGLIALAKYLSSQIEEWQENNANGIGPMEMIDNQRWIQVFMDTLAKDLRRMGSEFPKASKK